MSEISIIFKGQISDADLLRIANINNWDPEVEHIGIDYKEYVARYVLGKVFMDVTSNEICYSLKNDIAPKDYNALVATTKDSIANTSEIYIDDVKIYPKEVE